MRQKLLALLDLKALLVQRKFSLHLRFGPAIASLIYLGFYLILLAMGFVLASFFPKTVVYDGFGLIFFFLAFLYVIAPVSGARIQELFDFRALQGFPLTREFLYLATLLSACMDPAFMLMIPLFLGLSAGFASQVSWLHLPFFLIFLGQFFIFIVLACQFSFLAFHLFLRHTGWFYLFSTFLMPLGLVAGLFFLYIGLAQTVILFEPFTGFSFTYLQNTWFLPSSLPICAIRALHEGSFWACLSFFGLQILWILLLFYAGSYLVLQIQGQGVSEYRLGFISRNWTRPLLALMYKFPVFYAYLIEKDWKLWSRDPSFKVQMTLPFVVSTVIFILCAALANLQGYGQMFLHLWPLFLLGVVLGLAGEYSSNVFGAERDGIHTLFSLPVDDLCILGAKNLAVFLPAFLCLWLIFIISLLSGGLNLVCLQTIWLGHVLLLSLILPAGNLLSIYFPMRIESDLAASIQKAGFSRTLLFILLRLLVSVFSLFLLLPISLFLIFTDIKLGLSIYLPVTTAWPFILEHCREYFSLYGFLSLYALGIYLFTFKLFLLALSRRKSVLLMEFSRI